MLKAENIRARLKQLMSEATLPPNEDVSVFLHTIEWVGFAQHYNEAADSLSQRSGPVSDLPRILLSGHAVECALKACLVTKAHDVPRIHDLIVLSDRVLNFGFVLLEPELVAIAHLNSVFSEDLVSLTRFLVRYPSNQSEANFQRHVSQISVARIVDSLIAQVTKYNGNANRKPWSGVDEDA